MFSVGRGKKSARGRRPHFFVSLDRFPSRSPFRFRLFQNEWRLIERDSRWVFRFLNNCHRFDSSRATYHFGHTAPRTTSCRSDLSSQSIGRKRKISCICLRQMSFISRRFGLVTAFAGRQSPLVSTRSWP